MALDFLFDDPAFARAAQGLANFHVGQSAEEAIARHYIRKGDQLLHRRWRGQGGEVDLILAGADGATIFVEVKYGATHDHAATRLHPAQARRIMRIGEAYLGAMHGHADVEMRFDLALVDRQGRIEVIENAFLDF